MMVIVGGGSLFVGVGCCLLMGGGMSDESPGVVGVGGCRECVLFEF
jgi:hypothetical protein